MSNTDRTGRPPFSREWLQRVLVAILDDSGATLRPQSAVYEAMRIADAADAPAEPAPAAPTFIDSSPTPNSESRQTPEPERCARCGHRGDKHYNSFGPCVKCEADGGLCAPVPAPTPNAEAGREYMTFPTQRERLERFNSQVGASSWKRRPASEHPDACVCNADEWTPHVHDEDGVCRRCVECKGYSPKVSPAPKPPPGAEEPWCYFTESELRTIVDAHSPGTIYTERERLARYALGLRERLTEQQSRTVGWLEASRTMGNGPRWTQRCRSNHHLRRRPARLASQEGEGKQVNLDELRQLVARLGHTNPHRECLPCAVLALLDRVAGAEKRNRELADRATLAESRVHVLESEVADWRNQARQASERADTLAGALREYGRHAEGCNADLGYPCKCGWDETRDALGVPAGGVS